MKSYDAFLKCSKRRRFGRRDETLGILVVANPSSFHERPLEKEVRKGDIFACLVEGNPF